MMQSSNIFPVVWLQTVLLWTSSIGGPLLVVVVSRSTPTNVFAKTPEPISVHCFSADVISLSGTTGPGCDLTNLLPTTSACLRISFASFMMGTSESMAGHALSSSVHWNACGLSSSGSSAGDARFAVVELLVPDPDAAVDDAAADELLVNPEDAAGCP